MVCMYMNGVYEIQAHFLTYAAQLDLILSKNILSTKKIFFNPNIPIFSPFNKTHGDIQSDERHVGDYGLIETDQNGIIRITKFDKLSKLFGPTSIIGRTIVIHHDADDLGLGDNSDSKSSGHSGSRVACGIIGIDKMD